MGTQMRILTIKLIEAWSHATLFDYTYTAAWIVLVGYLIGKSSRHSAY
ncbi:MAG: hypothetical protein Tsb009_08130 [Planctomycetaceae bacterium]